MKVFVFVLMDGIVNAVIVDMFIKLYKQKTTEMKKENYDGNN